MAETPICSVAECGKVVRLKNLCGPHYHRLVRHGDPLGGRRPLGHAIADIFRALETDTDDCIFWTHARNQFGRGNVFYQGKYYSASRLVCILAHGTPAPKMEAAHSCGNGHLACINPRHLRWATRAENIADMFLHGTAPIGEQSPSAKLSELDVIHIKARLKTGEMHTTIAKDFGVSASNISMIGRGKTWSYLK
jgi:hypothetical protein